MSFTKNYITQKGLALNARLVKGGELTITRVVAAAGNDMGIELSERTDVQTPVFLFETNQGVLYDRVSQPNRITIPVYYENSELTAFAEVTEIGVFAFDPEEGEILYSIAASYATPMGLPPFMQGRVELTADIIVELSLTHDVTVSLPESRVYLTRPEADKLYWIIGEKYPATEITETTGETTEEAQRRQDERLRIIEDVLSSGTTSSVTVDIDAYQPLKWKIMNYHGWYDAANSVYRA